MAPKADGSVDRRDVLTRAARAVLVAVWVVVVMLLSAGVADAHPGFRPDEIEAGVPSTVDLVIEHDCDAVGGVEAPTTVVAIQVPDALATVEPLHLPGWRTSTESDESGRTTTVQWTAEADADRDAPPILPVRLTARTTDDPMTIALVVLQECSRGSYLWGGGDDREPPVSLRILPGVLAQSSASELQSGGPASTPTVEPSSPRLEPSAAAPSLRAGSPSEENNIRPREDGSSLATALGPVLWAVAVLALATAGGLWMSRR